MISVHRSASTNSLQYPISTGTSWRKVDLHLCYSVEKRNLSGSKYSNTDTRKSTFTDLTQIFEEEKCLEKIERFSVHISDANVQFVHLMSKLIEPEEPSRRSNTNR